MLCYNGKEEIIMRLLLLYFTGTYHTRYVTQKLKEKLKDCYMIDCIEVNQETPKQIDLSCYDMIGIGYPIYAFNIPNYFWKFLKRQSFPITATYFIYKNSGETYAANDTSSFRLIHFLKKKQISVQNEYHFMMPYNIHFRFDERLVREMLSMNEKMYTILKYDLMHGVTQQKKYLLRYRFVTKLLRIQSWGGTVNSFFYRVDLKKCIRCQSCIKMCPVHNIDLHAKGKIIFHHHCLMCMRCSMFCPTDAIHIGLLEKWKVNGPYPLAKIEKMELSEPYITKETKGFFRCYVKTYQEIESRYQAIKDQI